MISATEALRLDCAQLSDQEKRQFWDVLKVMHEVRQGAKTLSTPMKELRAEFQSGHIVYEQANGLLRWNMDSCDVEIDKNEGYRPIKVRSRARIDGAVSLIVAYATYSENRKTFEDVWAIQGR